MPLSDHEQRLLEQMEQALYAEDPRFASVLQGEDLRVRYRRRLVVAVLGFVAGIALLMSGLVLYAESANFAVDPGQRARLRGDARFGAGRRECLPPQRRTTASGQPIVPLVERQPDQRRAAASVGSWSGSKSAGSVVATRPEPLHTPRTTDPDVPGRSQPRVHPIVRLILFGGSVRVGCYLWAVAARRRRNGRRPSRRVPRASRGTSASFSLTAWTSRPVDGGR